MPSDTARLVGSRTAKGGFANEAKIQEKINNWKSDKEAQDWLITMGYDLKNVKNVRVIKPSNKQKTDLKLVISILNSNQSKYENISIKRSENSKGYNQIDRRNVDAYAVMWEIPDEIVSLLKYFTGECVPIVQKPKDARRTFLNEMFQDEQKLIVSFFDTNKEQIANDLFKGREEEKPNWFLVTYYNKHNDTTTYLLENIDNIIDLYLDGEISVTDRGSLKIGNITMQRKGGTPDPTSLQFKIDPMLVFK